MRIYDGSADKKAYPTTHTVSVVSANRISNTKNGCMTIRKNGRDDWSLFFCESGILHFEGEMLNAGEVWIYPPKIPQRYVAYSNDKAVYRYLHFTGSNVRELVDTLGIKQCTPIKIEQIKSVVKAFDGIQAAMCFNSPLSQLEAEYHTLFLLSQLAVDKKQTLTDSSFRRVIDDMEHSFAEPYDALRYAKMINLSVSRFNHLFKERIGIPPYTYFLKIRIDNAAELLTQTDIKIKDVAYRCGFDDPLYFTQAFKRLRGLTPSQYKKLAVI